jgi:hypothetical protein
MNNLYTFLFSIRATWPAYLILLDLIILIILYEGGHRKYAYTMFNSTGLEKAMAEEYNLVYNKVNVWYIFVYQLYMFVSSWCKWTSRLTRNSEWIHAYVAGFTGAKRAVVRIINYALCMRGIMNDSVWI